MPVKQKIFYFFALIIIGFLSGLVAILMRESVGFFHNLFFLGKISFNYNPFLHTPIKNYVFLIILAPFIGSIIVSFLIQNFAPEAKGHGFPEVMYAILYNNSVIRPIVAIVKAIASGISIGSGGAGGIEGPITQISATIGSFYSRFFNNLPAENKAIFLSSGVSAGLAAGFNAPIAGILYSIELLSPKMSLENLTYITVATLIGVLTSNAYFGTNNFILVPYIEHPAIGYNYLIYMSLGIITGFAAAFFIIFIHKTEKLFERNIKNYYIRHAFGMFLVGIIIYLMARYTGHYQVEGSGFASIRDLLYGNLSSYKFAIFLAIIKLLVVCLTLGSGASGGIFSPSLFIGASIGAGFCLLLSTFLPSLSKDIALFAVLGMGGMVSASIGAILFSIVIILEITGSYNIIIPVILVNLTASFARKILCKESIYTIKLNEKIKLLHGDTK